MTRRRSTPASRSRAPRWTRLRSRSLVVPAAVALLFLAIAGVYLRNRTPVGAVQPPRNVLLITIDTLRWDHVGCYGAKLPATPVLDRLAARGVRFDSAIMHTPLTAPSHASILTGLTPLAHGVRDNGAFALPAGVPTLATTFKGAHYETAAFVSGYPLDRRFGFATGFDVYDDRLPRSSRPGMPGTPGSERRADATTGRAIAWLANRRSEKPSRNDGAAPWFVWVHYFDPHAAYEPPDEWRARYAGDPYDGEIAFVDDQIGRLFQALESRGDAANTFVLVTSDHGESLGQHGEETHGVFVYDATLRVPWIVAGPGVPEGRVSTVVARGIDAMPTLLELARVPVPGGRDGRSLVPALRGARMADEPAYIESLLSARHFGWAELHGIRTAAWKYILAPSPELYDLVNDRSESANVLQRQPARAEALSRQVQEMIRANAAVQAASPPRDPEAERRLAALGYITRTVRRRPGDAGRDPKSAVSLINRIEHAIAESRVDPRHAIEQLQKILAEDPGITLARSQLAAAFSAAGEHRAAVEQIEILRGSGSAGADDLLLMSESLRALGRTREAALARNEAARLDPLSPEPALTEAGAAMAAGRTREAADAYNRALRIAPENVEALAGLGEIALRQGDVPAASAYCERVLAQDPGDVTARTRLGMIRGREGRFADAIRLLRQAVDEAPDNAEALAGLAAALARSGMPAAAVPYFERALAAGPHTPAVLNGLGFARLETGDRAGALAALRSSLAVNPDQPRIVAAVRDLSAGGPADGRGAR